MKEETTDAIRECMSHIFALQCCVNSLIAVHPQRPLIATAFEKYAHAVISNVQAMPWTDQQLDGLEMALEKCRQKLRR